MKNTALISRFAKSTDGNFAMMTALAAVAIFGAVGLGVNTSQLMHTKSNLRHALDAAVTSTARDLTTGVIEEAEAKQAVLDYLLANVGSGFAVDKNFWIDELKIDKSMKTISAVAAANVDVAFPLLGMGKRHKVTTAAAATYSDSKIEVAIMLDLTLSMNESGSKKNGIKQTKLQNLQDAATDAVKDLLGRNTKQTDPRVRVALVPYSQGVNAGPMSAAVWYEGSGVPEQPQSVTWLEHPDNVGVKTSMQTVKTNIGDKCATERKALVGGELTQDVSDAGPDVRMVNRDNDLPRNGCPSAELIPLSADTAKLVSAIGNFKTTGSTAGHIGIQWTQYVLSPAWGDFIEHRVSGGNKSIPGAYTDPKLRKIAILMTDGEFNTAYAGVSEPGMKADGKKKSPQYADALCTLMKGNDIEVFTIGFMLQEAAAKATMKNCASPDKDGIRHFYDASDGNELKAAFNAITANIERVQLTN